MNFKNRQNVVVKRKTEIGVGRLKDTTLDKFIVTDAYLRRVET